MSHIVTGIGKSNLYRFPSSQKELYSQLKRSQILESLWEKRNDGDQINSPTTLPMHIKSKIEVNHEVKANFPEKTGLKLLLKQYTTYGKLIINFYKEGVKNIWRNKKEMNKLMKKEFKLGNIINNKGRETAIRIPSFLMLNQQMAQAIYTSKVENKTYNDETRGDIINSDKVEKYLDTGLFNLSRRQYQILKRTPVDWLKFPAFSLILLVFFEMTPALCYIFPEITPLTCILPSILPKVWSQASLLKLIETKKNVQPENIDEILYRSAYSLPLNDARLLSRTLKLTSKYIPSLLYPESLLRRRLQDHFNYLTVDNYYLSGLNNPKEGNLWNLSNQELLVACLERGLVPNLKEAMDGINKTEDTLTRASKEKEFYDSLRVKLMKFIIDFDKFNIGYITLLNNLEQPNNIKGVISWRT